MIVKLLTEHHLEFLCLTGGCGGWSESTLVKMSNCWKSQSTAQMLILDSCMCMFEMDMIPMKLVHLLHLMVKWYSGYI